MTWLNPGCSEPRAPIAACFPSVCCLCWFLVLVCAAVCAAGPEATSGKFWRQVCTHCLYSTVRYYKPVCTAVGTFVRPLSSCILPPQFLLNVSGHHQAFSCHYAVFSCSLKRQPPPKYPHILHIACSGPAPMNAKGGVWWSNLRMSFTVDEGLVLSTGVCVCGWVGGCMSAIQSIPTGENKDCWHGLLPTVTDHHKARSLFVNH